jgi:hypothetical protein
VLRHTVPPAMDDRAAAMLDVSGTDPRRANGSMWRSVPIHRSHGDAAAAEAVTVGLKEPRPQQPGAGRHARSSNSWTRFRDLRISSC